MYLNALLEESISNDDQMVEVACSGGLYCGRVMSASLEGEMFGLNLANGRGPVYIAKATVYTLKFIDESAPHEHPIPTDRDEE